MGAGGRESQLWPVIPTMTSIPALQRRKQGILKQDRSSGQSWRERGKGAFTELFALGAFELPKQFPGSSFSKYLLGAF